MSKERQETATTSTPTIMKRIFQKLTSPNQTSGSQSGGGGSSSGLGHHHHHHHSHNSHMSEDRSDILTNATTNTSFTSLNDIESLKLKQQLWSKNRIILISIAVIIIVIIVFITLLAFEPWK